MRRRGGLSQLSAQLERARGTARRLARAAQSGVPMAEAVSRFLAAWRDEIAPHLRLEEEVLLPALACRLCEADALIVMTLTDHVALRRAVRELARTPGEAGRGLGLALGRRLEEHVGFEEATLLPALRSLLDPAALATVERELREAVPPSAGARQRGP